MRAVILVPRRSGVHPARDKAWEHTREWWAKLGYPIHVVEHPGPEPFNRALALNQGAREAWPWDVAMFLDSDVIENDEEQVHEAFGQAYDTGRMTVAHTTGKDLTKHGTNLVYEGVSFNWDDHLAEVREVCDSRANVVRADLFEKVGGFDERFRGWGHEDVAFFTTCQVAAGPAVRVPGNSWHFWHPHMLAISENTTNWREGDKLNYRYTYATRVGWDALKIVLDEREKGQKWERP